MTTLATITSQGQLTIPVKLREQVGLKKPGKVFLDVEDNNIIIKPANDILSLIGSLHAYAKKGLSIDKIIEEEERAVGEAIAEKYRKTMTSKRNK